MKFQGSSSQLGLPHLPAGRILISQGQFSAFMMRMRIFLDDDEILQDVSIEVDI